MTSIRSKRGPDYTWNLFKTFRHLNRFGSTFSFFNSFALKILNNLLPTGDLLSKRHDQLYDNWTCLFCENAPETLDHLFVYPALTQQWIDITKSSLSYLRSI